MRSGEAKFSNRKPASKLSSRGVEILVLGDPPQISLVKITHAIENQSEWFPWHRVERMHSGEAQFSNRKTTNKLFSRGPEILVLGAPPQNSLVKIAHAIENESEWPPGIV